MVGLIGLTFCALIATENGKRSFEKSAFTAIGGITATLTASPFPTMSILTPREKQGTNFND